MADLEACRNLIVDYTYNNDGDESMTKKKMQKEQAERMRSREELKRSHEHLEQQVEARTAELARTNVDLMENNRPAQTD